MFSDHTKQQRIFSDKNAASRWDENIDFGGSPDHELIRDTPIREAVRLMSKRGVDLDGKRILVVGCGLGTDLFYLKRHASAEYFCTDISENNVRTTKKFFPDVIAQVANAETLPFPDDHFDFAWVCDSLHHMARPYLGIYEMLRVAKAGICVIEPHNCLLTRFSTRAGLMQEYEAAGNYVLKIDRSDIHRLAKTFRFEHHCSSVFATDFGIIGKIPPRFRRFVYPLFHVSTKVLNALVPQQGNAFIGIILK